MAATKIVAGVIREIWQDDAGQANVSVPVATGIAISARQLSRLRGTLTVYNFAGGVPVITAVASITNKRLVVTINNTTPGTTFKWLLDVELTQSTQQGTDGSHGAIIQVVNGTLSAGIINPQTLHQTYNFGAVALDQTLVLDNATKGGGVVLDGSTGAFTGAVYSLDILAPSAGFVRFPRVGGFQETSTVSIASAPGAFWNDFWLQGSMVTLTGAPGAVTDLSMARVGQARIEGAGNTIADAYNLFVTNPPTTNTATITRSWSLGVTGNAQFWDNVCVGLGFAPGLNASGTVVMSVDATPPVASVGLVHIYARPFTQGTGKAALSWSSEEPVNATPLTATHLIPVVFNGVSYWVLAQEAVPD